MCVRYVLQLPGILHDMNLRPPFRTYKYASTQILRMMKYYYIWLHRACRSGSRHARRVRHKAAQMVLLRYASAYQVTYTIYMGCRCQPRNAERKKTHMCGRR